MDLQLAQLLVVARTLCVDVLQLLVSVLPLVQVLVQPLVLVLELILPVFELLVQELQLVDLGSKTLIPACRLALSEPSRCPSSVAASESRPAARRPRTPSALE